MPSSRKTTVAPDPSIGVVQATHITKLSASNQSVAITADSRSLASVLLQSTSPQEQLARQLENQRAGELLPSERIFNDDCTVIQRNGENWYFVWPTSSDLLVQQIALRDGDSVVTMPFSRTPFFQERSETDAEIGLVGLANAGPEKLIVEAGVRERNLGTLVSGISFWNADRSRWTATVVTRSDGRTIHHAVLAAGKKANTEKRPATEPLNPVGQRVAELRNGDILEMTDFMTVIKRFQ
ncbi:MAG: hypothetical protein KDB22_07415 [Planctomycetales bacterium]|nr:hypothetical protein [Planctomycetales bacterium]